MHSPILAPVIALVLWSLFMGLWAASTRLPALRTAGISLAKVHGSRPGGLDGVLPDKVQWKIHNYNHLMEQPTIFYATALTLALVGAGEGANLIMAWAYVGLRIAHSLVQVTTNIIRVRFSLFMLATIVQAALAVSAAVVIF